MGRASSISVYLIVYNDYDHLAAALSSVEEFADEIVVVDGAYEWLSPLIAPLGLTLDRSCDECTDVLHNSSCASKIRYFSGTWETESHKRAFAYEQCSKDLVYLLDADELHALDNLAISRFVNSKEAVASVVAPFFATDRLASRHRNDLLYSGFPPKPVVFKRSVVSAWEHLAYLWMARSKQVQHRIPARNDTLIRDEPVGSMYHLTHLRTAKTAIHRCRWYEFNTIREEGVGFYLPQYVLGAGADLSIILEKILPRDLDGLLRGCSMTLGFHDVDNYEYFEVDVDRVRGRQLSRAYEAFRRSMDGTIRVDETNLVAQREKETFVDVSSILLGATGDYRLTLRFDAALSAIRAEFVVFEKKGMVRRPCFDGPVDGPLLDCVVRTVDPEGEKPFRILLSITPKWRQPDQWLGRLTSLELGPERIYVASLG